MLWSEGDRSVRRTVATCLRRRLVFSGDVNDLDDSDPGDLITLRYLVYRFHVII
jgi:hypothetical protein